MKVEEKVKNNLCELSGVEINKNNAAFKEDLTLDRLSMVMLLLDFGGTFVRYESIRSNNCSKRY